MNDKDSILIRPASLTATRGRGTQELNVNILAENVNLFLVQMEKVLEKTPEDIGDFKFTEFEIAVEVSGKGQLIVLGSGVEASAKGGLTFKFQRNMG